MNIYLIFNKKLSFGYVDLNCRKSGFCTFFSRFASDCQVFPIRALFVKRLSKVRVSTKGFELQRIVITQNFPISPFNPMESPQKIYSVNYKIYKINKKLFELYNIEGNSQEQGVVGGF